jgi:single-strand DNA-binding protein
MNESKEYEFIAGSFALTIYLYLNFRRRSLMSRSLNKACILGTAGRDAEIRYTNNGKAVATFSVATNESWKDQSGTMQERTTWHNIVAWERMAEICGNYVKKGKQVYIEGRIQNREYDDKDGVKKRISEIILSEMILLGGGPDKGSSSNGERSFGGSPQSQHSSEPVVSEFDQNVPDADLPF